MQATDVRQTGEVVCLPIVSTGRVAFMHPHEHAQGTMDCGDDDDDDDGGIVSSMSAPGSLAVLAVRCTTSNGGFTCVRACARAHAYMNCMRDDEWVVVEASL